MSCKTSVLSLVSEGGDDVEVREQKKRWRSSSEQSEGRAKSLWLHEIV